MGITHSWNGTVLTITSDSGTSSADLKGDTGIRGPQGAAGTVDTNYIYTITNPPTAEEVGARGIDWLPTPEEIGATSVELLWQNASYGSSFVAQTLDIKTFNHDAFLIQYMNDVSVGASCGVALFAPMRLGAVDFTYSFETYEQGTGIVRYNRFVYFDADENDNSLLRFGDTVSYYNGTSSIKNSKFVPVKIYGVKFLKDSINTDTATKQIVPFILTANSRNESPVEYTEFTSFGDKTIRAIKQGRQVLVFTPQDQINSTKVVYSPVFKYELPSYNDNFIHLYYWRDELDSNGRPVIGKLTLRTSETYFEDPLGGAIQ